MGAIPARILLAALALGAAGWARAQDDGMAALMGGFAGVPYDRLASGTSWQPDTSPMHGSMQMIDDWMVMCHYNAFLSFDDQLGPRGGHQIDSTGWGMIMATRRIGADEFTLRAMLDLEPWTVTKRGYPLLFQTGEAYNGAPLVDRQHPHNFFMELAARYRHALDALTALSLYLAPVGEPALGPTAFPHRLSAMDDPAAPISHHWMDSTHIAFGVATLGLTRGNFQLEGSWFNGREPNQDRWSIYPPHLDSYSGRLSWNPAAAWSAQVSYGYMKSPEELTPLASEHRSTASVSNTRPLGGDRVVATTVGWGQNLQEGRRSNAFLAESDCQITPRYTIFDRVEWVQKTGEELALAPTDSVYDITQATLGLSRELLPPSRPLQLALGAAATCSWIPDSLQQLYGPHPIGYWIFLRVRPSLMKMRM